VLIGQCLRERPIREADIVILRLWADVRYLPDHSRRERVGESEEATNSDGLLRAYTATEYFLHALDNERARFRGFPTDGINLLLGW